jgi:hypothetical protein
VRVSAVKAGLTGNKRLNPQKAKKEAIDFRENCERSFIGIPRASFSDKF